jgi:hypothetical protein
MGRPLNKKYFGNRNVGVGGQAVNPLHNSQNASDDRIGGEGVANVSFGGGNIGAYLARIPSATFSTPNIPGGVQATGTVTNVQAVKANVFAEGQGYNVGDIFSIAGTGTAATFRVTSLRVQSFTVANPTGAGNTAYDLGNVVALDSSTAAIGGNSPNWASPFVIRPITVGTGGNSAKLSGGTIANVAGITGGRWTGTGAPPASFTLTAENTRGDSNVAPGAGFGLPNYGGTGDCNAAGAVLNIIWGIGDIELVTAGDYTAVNAAHQAVTRVSGATPTVAAQMDVYYGVKTVAISQRGSGYTTVADAVPTFSTVTGEEVRAVGAAVLTTDSGLVGSATNQENAIVIYANTDEAGAKIGDIIRQVNSRSYKVKTADGTAVCKLVADDTPAFGKAYIIATDDNGNTYFVTKLTAHKARLERFTNNEEDWLFANGESARWTFGNAQAGDRKSVQIENA